MQKLVLENGLIWPVNCGGNRSTSDLYSRNDSGWVAFRCEGLMLFAVEGGGFFSASASGYSKGLALLLFGQKDKDKLVRVIPLNPYHLVDHETSPEPQHDSGKIWPVRWCDCFLCFLSTLKVDTAQNQGVLTEYSDFAERKDQTHLIDEVNGKDSDTKIISLKSILKKSSNGTPVAASGREGNINEVEASREKRNEIACHVEGRKLQWTDKIGGELFEIREFEMSEHDSDDKFDYGSKKTCSCWLM